MTFVLDAKQLEGRMFVEPIDGGLGGVDAAAHPVSDHAWEVESIVAARRAPECVGGWEYLVRWGGFDDAGERWEDSWEPEAKLELSDEMRADLRTAQRTRSSWVSGGPASALISNSARPTPRVQHL